MHDLPPFPGFRNEAFVFMQDLTRNNNREWFKPRKSMFDDEILWPMRCLVVDAGKRAAKAGIPLVGNPDRGIFRIYRDTRFSKDKSPYKTQTGAVLSRTGDRNDPGVVYIHFEPGQAFLAAGFWQPEVSFVRLWRDRMLQQPGPFLDMVRSLEERDLTLGTEDSLKRMPRGYEDLTDTELGPFLRLKSFITSRPIADEELKSPDFSETVYQMMLDSLPLLQYGWDVERWKE